MKACARLGGYLTGDLATPDNPAVRKSLSAMLTPYLARKLSNEQPAEVREDYDTVSKITGFSMGHGMDLHTG